MRKTKRLFPVGMILLALSVVMFTVGPAIAQQATGAVLVKIEPGTKGEKDPTIYINPATRYAKQNTIVVWMNGVMDTEVQVVFEDGKTCRDVSANPNLKIPGFFMDSKQCYVTSFLPYADTSTLQFVEVGTYE